MILSASERLIDDNIFIIFKNLSWENKESLMADPSIITTTFLPNNFAVMMGIIELCPPKMIQHFECFEFLINNIEDLICPFKYLGIFHTELSIA